MLRFVGCDVHKRTAVFTILLQEGTPLASYTVPVTREALAAFAERQLSRQDRRKRSTATYVCWNRPRWKSPNWSSGWNAKPGRMKKCGW